MKALAALLSAGAALLAAAQPLLAAAAESPPPLEEIVVNGERAGPGLWHVYKGSAQLWIFGTVTPLPKDMTWRSKQLEGILDGTDQVLVAKPFEIGIARLMAARDTAGLAHGRARQEAQGCDACGFA